MNYFLFTIFTLGYSSIALGNFLWIDVLRNKTTGQYIILISDRHSLEYQGARQADSIARIIKSLPRQTTGVLLEYPNTRASAACKKSLQIAVEANESAALAALYKKLDKEGIRYEGLDIRDDILFSILSQQLQEPEKPLHYHDALDQYQENIDMTAQFFQCEKSNDQRSKIEQYACSLLDLTQAQYRHQFQIAKSYRSTTSNSSFDLRPLIAIIQSGWFEASAVEFDVIALQKIIENRDKKVIFVAAGMAHCQGLKEVLQKEMGLTLEKLPLQHITDKPSSVWPNNYHREILKTPFSDFIRPFELPILSAPGLSPTEITCYLGSLPLRAPQFSIKRGAPLTYSHVQRWCQDHRQALTYSAACTAIATCSTLLFKRRLFGKWGSR